MRSNFKLWFYPQPKVQIYMIDYISIQLNCTPESLLSNKVLDFQTILNERTGEILPHKRVAHLSSSLTIEIICNPQTNVSSCFLKGSLHKHALHNRNCDDYNMQQFETTVIELTDTLQISPKMCNVRAFEYGVNVSPTHITKNVLNSIIAYNGYEYEKRAFNGNGYLKKFVSSQYEIKVYDKAMQYHLTDNILRYEMKVTKMQFVRGKNIPIVTLSDLLNRENIQRLNELLLNTFRRLYVFDYRINTKCINNRRDRNTLIECSNPTFWTIYRQIHTPTGYKKKVKRFNELVKKYAPDNLKKCVEQLITDKLKNLSNCYPILPLSKNATVTRFYTHIVGNNGQPMTKYCLTCGRDISNQKNNSKFCSEKTYGPHVKVCRNKVSNLKRDEKRKYPSDTLFDIDNYLQPELKRLKQIAYKRN